MQGCAPQGGLAGRLGQVQASQLIHKAAPLGGRPHGAPQHVCQAHIPAVQALVGVVIHVDDDCAPGTASEHLPSRCVGMRAERGWILRRVCLR